MTDTLTSTVIRHDEIIKALNERLNRLENLSADVTELKVTVEAIQVQVQQLSKRIENMQKHFDTEIGDLKNRIDKLNGLYKWIIGLLFTTMLSVASLVATLVAH